MYQYFFKKQSSLLANILRHNFKRNTIKVKTLHVTALTNQITYPAESSAVGFDNYEDEYKSFQLEKPEYFNFAKDVLEIWADREKGLSGLQVPGHALWYVNDEGEEIKWTFKQLLQHSNRLANVLSEVGGLKPLDRVIVILPRIPEWWLVNVSCLKLGCILSPGTTSLTKNDIVKRINASDATCVITTTEISKIIDQIPDADVPTLTAKFAVENSNATSVIKNGWLPVKKLMSESSTTFQCLNTKSDDAMSWFFTSGTTGYPKMTEHTHASYGLAHKMTGKYWLDLTERDIMWNVSDTGWAKSAYSSVYAPWWQGACVFVHDTQRFDVKKTLGVLEKFPITVTCLPPTAYRLIMQDDKDSYAFKALRHCVSAGEPLNPEVIESWKKKTGLTIREGFGQTEMTLSCGIFRCMEVKPGSMGKATPGYDIKIIDENSDILTSNKEGDIAVRCYPNKPIGMFSKYVKNEEKTADAYRGDYYLTGDRGYKDSDGYLWFVGRSDDVIISAGYRIGPFEVESALLEHDEVAESAVISSPCETRGSIVKAFIVLVEGGSPSDQLKIDLQDHVKQMTAPYKYPRLIEFVDALPKTISGKIRRVELRQKEWQQ